MSKCSLHLFQIRCTTTRLTDDRDGFIFIETTLASKLVGEFVRASDSLERSVVIRPRDRTDRDSLRLLKKRATTKVTMCPRCGAGVLVLSAYRTSGTRAHNRAEREFRKKSMTADGKPRKPVKGEICTRTGIGVESHGIQRARFCADST